MPLRFRCECGQKLKCPDEALDKRAKCPKCGLWLHVPNSSSYDTVADPSHAKGEEEHPSDVDKLRVVVADSQDSARGYLAVMLREHGYLVFEANDGAKAIELIRDKKPHAAILDVRLDSMSGFQVVEQIHNPANPRNEDVWSIPVIMTTDKLRGRDKQYSMSLGAKAFFVKPLTPADICHRLEKEASGYAGR